MAAQLRVVLLGDSVNWGQGLREDQKSYTLVEDPLASGGAVAQGTVLAHSGATIGINVDEGQRGRADCPEKALKFSQGPALTLPVRT